MNEQRLLTRPDIQGLVVSAVHDFAASERDLELAPLSDETALFGEDGLLSSIGLVSVLVAIESEIEDRHGISIVIADERAVSQTRSPFRTVGALTDYVTLLVTEPNEAEANHALEAMGE